LRTPSGATPARAASIRLRWYTGDRYTGDRYTDDMRHNYRRRASLGKWIPALLVLGFIAQAPANAEDYRAGNLIVTQPWSPATPPVASVGAVYFSITNNGPKADLLLSVTSPIARMVEIHESREVQGSIRMREVASVECPAGATVKISPGGLHVMLLGMRGPLVAGMTFPASLHFRDAGVVSVQVLVAAPE
jgi:copper(I)-binding protein